MAQTDSDTLAQWRNHVARAHTLVVSGRYADAVRAFGEAVGPMTDLLGKDHPEVAELIDDLAAAASMGDIAAFVDEAGFRYGTPFPKP